MKKQENKKVSNKVTKKNTSKKKINVLKIIIFFLIIICIIGYSFRSVIKLIVNPTNTVIVKEGTISKEESDIGYIIRDETVVTGENYKNGMEQIVDEGKKVSKDQAMFRYFSAGEEKINEKIKVLDLKIQEAIENSSDQLFTSDTKLLDNQIDKKIKEISSLNNIQKIQEYKKSLINYVTKKAKISGQLSPNGSYLKKLIDERNTYENKLNSDSEYITAPRSGIVSYRIDGLEETLNPTDFSKYNKNFLNELNLKTGQIISTNSEKGKIINNFICYIACTSKSKEANKAEVGNKVQITLPSTKVVSAKIEYISKESDDEVTLVLSFNEGIDELAMYRKVSFDITWWNSTGYKVPNTAIITENNLSYVIRTKSGYLDKVLVKVERRGEDYSVVSSYSGSELKDLSIKNNIKTSILLYDQLLLYPTESQIKDTE